MHLGNAWAFLLAWLSARAAGGEVVLRLEDIDPERSRPEFAAELLRDLRWPGLDWDEELRTLASAPHAQLVDDGSPVYPGTCRDLGPEQRENLLRQGRRPCLRLRCEDLAVVFSDLLAGPQTMSLTDCGGDFALRRSDGVFAYQLAVVLDDIAMGVTQVVRGDDILASTPRQIFLYRLLGAPIPQYAHLPLVLDHEGERLAKRHNSLTVAALCVAGVSAQAITGYLAWRGGLQDAPRPVDPHSLVAGFDICSIRRESVRLPADIMGVLARLG